MKHYAPCLWKPHILKTPKEITHVLDALQVRNKKIKRIDFIGIAKNMEELDRELYGKMRDAGIPPDEMKSWKYRDSIRIPCKAVLCEPVVFTFEDGTAVAMMPSFEGSLKLSINKVNANTTGLNHRNTVASKLFQPLIGKYLNEVSVYHTTIREYWKTYETGNKEYVIQFRTKDKHRYGDCGIEFSYRYGGWYTVSLTDQHWHTYRGNAIKSAEYAEIRKALIPCNQVMIVEGHDSSSYFWIRPVEQTPNADSEVRYHETEEISIEEMDVSSFLYPFLEKYFDPDFPYTCRDPYFQDGFQWNLEHNLYTYETMYAMLDEISETVDLIRHHYKDPRLDALKRSFKRNISRDIPLSEQNRAMKEYALVAVDFYERFCRRMRLMMQHAPEFDLISFMGP